MASSSKLGYTDFRGLPVVGFLYQVGSLVMEITWFGHSAFRLKGKVTSVVTDPYDPSMIGLKLPKIEADIVTLSHDHGDHNNSAAVDGAKFIAKGPGEYEIGGVAFTGTASWHDNSKGSERGKNVIYTFNIDGLRVCHLGDIGQHQLTDEQVEDIGAVDILMIPVGGVYTVGAAEAAKIVTQLDPKVIIPMHYKLPDLKFDLEPVDHFLKEMGQETDPVTKYSISRDKLPDEPQVVVLEKQ
jgi:L-ascorbate metabolism protein UlaG (beta-lactamase superfamily)